MTHSAEQKRKKEESRREAIHHYHNSAVDGFHDDMETHEMMYKNPHQDSIMEKGK